MLSAELHPPSLGLSVFNKYSFLRWCLYWSAHAWIRFFVEFQREPLKLHTKYLAHTLKYTILIQCWNFKSSWIKEFIFVLKCHPHPTHHTATLESDHAQHILLSPRNSSPLILMEPVSGQFIVSWCPLVHHNAAVSWLFTNHPTSIIRLIPQKVNMKRLSPWYYNCRALGLSRR